MKKPLLFFAIAILGVYCFAFIKPKVQAINDPTSIILRDTIRSINLGCTQNGGIWGVSSGDPASYLQTVAYSSFQKDLTNFEGISIEFDSLYTKGSLTGFGTDSNGEKIPVGVEFSNGNGTDILNLYGGVEHTCTGAPCGCCVFIRRSGKIVGCTCGIDPLCEGHTCNHTMKTTE